MDERLKSARDKLLAGDAMGAFHEVLPIVSFPAELDEARFAEAFGLFAQIARAIAGDELGDSLAAAASSPNDPQRLFDAAYDLYEQQLFPIAATLLSRADELAPGNPEIVVELSANLEAMMAYGPAAALLEASGLPGRDAMCTYLHGFNALMCGDVETARRRAAELARVADDPEGTVRAIRTALEGMVARADAVNAAVPLTDRELTGWHAAINGCVLLHESPHGYDEGMNGRYAFVADSPALMREGLDRLRGVLEASGRAVDRVVAAPDRASRILARAAASILSLPYADWSPGEERRGLVVVWDLDAVGDPAFLQALQPHAPDQVLFAHASSWVSPFPYAPDVTTLLHQTITHPFTGGALHFDPEAGQVTRAEPDERDDDALAHLIVEAAPSDPSHRPLDDVLAVARALGTPPEPHAGGLHRRSGNRARQRAGSPVPSNRFA